MTANGYLLDTNICAFYLRGKFDIDLWWIIASVCVAESGKKSWF